MWTCDKCRYEHNHANNVLCQRCKDNLVAQRQAWIDDDNAAYEDYKNDRG